MIPERPLRLRVRPEITSVSTIFTAAMQPALTPDGDELSDSLRIPFCRQTLINTERRADEFAVITTGYSITNVCN